MGKKSDALAEQFSNAYSELDGRLTSLERLARQIRNGQTPVAQAESTAARSEVFPEDRDVVDYGAVAFGLSEIKAKVAQIVPAGHEGSMRREWEGVVDYFADVFAKADPGFDRAAFNRAAGR